MAYGLRTASNASGIHCSWSAGEAVIRATLGGREAIDAGMTARPTAFRAPATVSAYVVPSARHWASHMKARRPCSAATMCVMTTLLGPRNGSESQVSVDGSIASENRMTTCVSVGTWVDPSAGVAAATSGDATRLACLARRRADGPWRVDRKGPRRARDGHRRGGTPVSSTCHRHQRGGMP